MAPSLQKQLEAQIKALQLRLEQIKEPTKREKKVMEEGRLALIEMRKEQIKSGKEKFQKARAFKALKKFRPRKRDRGRLVFINQKGKRTRSKSSVGYLVRVKRTGKAVVVKDVKAGYAGIRLSSVIIPIDKRGQQFIESRKARNSEGKSIVKGRITVEKIKGPNDFNDKIVEQLADKLRATIQKQASQRSFAIEALVLIERGDGSTKVYSFSVPISKADHIAIEVAGMRNFVRQVFYKHLAQQLSFDGYVTSGSANHIRRLPENKGIEKDKWTKGSFRWESNEHKQVKIRKIEWRIVQLL